VGHSDPPRQLTENTTYSFMFGRGNTWSRWHVSGRKPLQLYAVSNESMTLPATCQIPARAPDNTPDIVLTRNKHISGHNDRPQEQITNKYDIIFHHRKYRTWSMRAWHCQLPAFPTRAPDTTPGIVLTRNKHISEHNDRPQERITDKYNVIFCHRKI